MVRIPKQLNLGYREVGSKEADLIDELSIEPGWELAAEAVLGDSLNAICVQEAATLKTMFFRTPSMQCFCS